jgi:hypothetical protein
MNTNPAIPDPRLLFEAVRDSYGLRLALVFGNEAPSGVCPFYGKQCYHCDIGAGEGVRFDPSLNRERLDWFRRHYAALLPRVAHLVVYNSGSVLNPRELSDSSLQTILAFAASLPECRVISLDSREGFITTARLDFVLGHLRPGQQLRPILGLETQDENARLEVLRKKMARSAIEAVFRALGRHAGRIGLDVNIVFAPPPFQGPAARAEAVATANFALELSQPRQIPVDFNLHPYYPSQIGRQRFPDHPRADLDAALETARTIRALTARIGMESRVFIGWQDEGHDQEPSLRSAELTRRRQAFDHFNAA